MLFYMDYSKIYSSIIDNRMRVRYEGYTESHHILPKCMGGSNAGDNLVRLSAREHYICHLLLTKIYPNNISLIRAVVLMGSQTGANSITYERLRAKFAVIQSASQSGENNSQYGTKWVYSISLRLSKKIKVNEQVPEGYTLGRVIDFDKLSQTSVREKLKAKNTMLYTELYRIYNELGWEQFRLQTGYDKSKPNFVQMCSRYVDEYVPQNGRRRGTAKNIGMRL